MGRTNKKPKKSIYDQIRKPMPKPAVAFKGQRTDRVADEDEWCDQVDANMRRRLNGG